MNVSFLLLLVSCFMLVLPNMVRCQTLRVGCQMGQPPFNDAHHVNDTVCQGLFAEAFYRVASKMNFTYNMTMLDTFQIDTLINVTAANTSQYDLIIGFHTITPERLVMMQFSITMYQTNWRVILTPAFHQQSMALVDAIVRDSVMYLFSILLCGAILSATTCFIFEHFAEEAEEFQSKPTWNKILFSLEVGIENVLTGNTSQNVFSAGYRFFRCLCGLYGNIFIIALFGAVVTSQLTISALGAGPPTLSDIRAMKIARAGQFIQEYMEGISVGANTIEVPNLEEFAIPFFQHQMHGFHGFVGPTEIVEHLHNRNGGEGFPMTNTFSPSGALDLKAMPFSLNVDPAFVAEFNYHIQEMKHSGEYATLTNLYVDPPVLPVADDFPVPSTAEQALRYLISIVGVLLVVGAFITYIQGKSREPRRKAFPAHEDGRLEYQGKTYFISEKELQKMLDAAVEEMEPAGTFNQDEAASTELVNSMTRGGESP